MNAIDQSRPRTWRYPDDVFLERALPGAVVAGLLRAEPQEIDAFKVTAVSPQPTSFFDRVAGQVDWRSVRMPWPGTGAVAFVVT
jgi:hypothetical protein